MNKLELKIKKLPDKPGIYLFYNLKKELIYAGKATSLKTRVRSYFSGQKTPRPIEEMIHEVVDLKYIVADSALEAIILESIYIKKFKPRYNVLGRDDKSWNYLTISSDDYPIVATIRQHEYKKIIAQASSKKEFQYIFGPYPSLNTKAALKILRRLFYFSNCQKIKRKNNKPCLYYQMGECFGVCTGEISPKEYRQKIIMPLVRFLKGNKKQVLRDFEKQMKKASNKLDFEEASRIRNQLYSLRRIQDIALLNSSFVVDIEKQNQNLRIEGYDISNLGKTGKVGSMVVFENGKSNKSNYRKFKIRSVLGQSDVDCIDEVLRRRLMHQEWKYPGLILVDGGKPQVNRAKRVIADFGLKIPVVGIAKGPKRNKNEFVLGSRNRGFIRWVESNQKLLVQVRDEAHRFAIAYQRKLRKIA